MTARLWLLPLVVYVGLGGLVLGRMARLARGFALCAGRRYRREARVPLVKTWHAPLLTTVLVLLTLRITQLVAVVKRGDDHQVTQWWDTWLVKVPDALTTILSAYFVFFLAHVVYFRRWSVSWREFSAGCGVVFAVFISLIVVVSTLFAYCSTTSVVLTRDQWGQFEWTYKATLWVVLGAVLLQIQARAMDALWKEREEGRVAIVRASGIHFLSISHTLLALLLILRGAAMGMVSFVNQDGILTMGQSGQDVMEFVATYGVWEVIVCGIILVVTSVVPGWCHPRCLLPTCGDEDSTLKPYVAGSVTFHVEIPHPREIVDELTRSTKRSFARSLYFQDVHREDDEEEAKEEDSFGSSSREPLLG